jgi:hypothetical protein
MDMAALEHAFSLEENDDQIMLRTIRLMQLATDLFGVICDHAEDTPVEILEAADDWYSYLTEVAGR